MATPELERIRQSDRPISETAAVMGDKAMAAADRVGQRINQTMEQAGSAMSTVQEKGSEVAGRAGDVIGNFRQAIEKSARSQPTTTVLMAVAAGFLLGAMWNSGSSYPRD
ncbi:hypothetical protein F7D13_12800 [Methylocystis rosea]|uniref:CsbD family protein n=1 Tax=Methylocystis rosea TaxID=173366 RepID=A0ABX6EK39_9HYPH|nr:hypothetical protein [Methylocystis rosea]QGM94825.1 hypothetical protein F7D13_12800 [Methylocystis rosea]